MARKKIRSRAGMSPQSRHAFAVAYLNAMLEDADPEELAAALSRIAQASGGSKLAEKVELSAGSLYRTLCRRGNPELRSATALLRAMGLRLVLERIPAAPRPADAGLGVARPRRKAMGYGTCVGSTAGRLQRDSHG
jgi:probable addiction module antidote protein